MENSILNLVFLIIAYQVIVPDTYLDEIIENKFPKIIQVKRNIINLIGKLFIEFSFWIYIILILLVIIIILIIFLK